MRRPIKLSAHRPLLSRGRHRPGLTLIELLVVIGILVILVAMLLPNVRSSRTPSRRTQCKNNLKQIGLALHNYHDVHNAFPPAYTVDADGRPLHSWRTLLLPYLDEDALYKTLDLTKPWDDPVNAAALDKTPAVYRCPSLEGPPTGTIYLAVAGDHAAFRPDGSRQLADFTDGTSNTVLVIEAAHKAAVPWMAPVDGGAEALLSINPDSQLPHTGGTHALYADGSVRFFPADTSAADREAMITDDGGEPPVE